MPKYVQTLMQISEFFQKSYPLSKGLIRLLNPLLLKHCPPV
jgi:hypothetical protein